MKNQKYMHVLDERSSQPPNAASATARVLPSSLRIHSTPYPTLPTQTRSLRNETIAFCVNKNQSCGN